MIEYCDFLERRIQVESKIHFKKSKKIFQSHHFAGQQKQSCRITRSAGSTEKKSLIYLATEVSSSFLALKMKTWTELDVVWIDKVIKNFTLSTIFEPNSTVHQTLVKLALVRN